MQIKFQANDRKKNRAILEIGQFFMYRNVFNSNKPKKKC